MWWLTCGPPLGFSVYALVALFTRLSEGGRTMIVKGASWGQWKRMRLRRASDIESNTARRIVETR
jgi:hypothetical protein